MRIAYLVPEFPAQTHNFFWKEIEALQTKGVESVLISTRRPAQALISHTWAQTAQHQTTYLAEIGLREAWAILIEYLRLGPAAWLRALTSCLDGCPPGRVAHNLGLTIAATKLSRLMRDNGLSHVHSHSCGNAALIVMLANRLTRVRYSLTLHGDLWDYGAQQHVKFRHADFAIAITKRLQNQVKEMLDKDAPRRIGLAPMGVDTEVFKRKVPYAPWTREGPLQLFSCGRLNFVKGHQELIHAVKLLRDAGTNVILQIAGEDDLGGDGYRKTLEALICELRLEMAVILLGAVPVSRVLDCLASSQLFVLASHHEPLGVAIMEAMSYETPVIATNLGGVPELVEHLVDGYLVSPGDPKLLADSIWLVASDQAMANRFSEAGRRKILEGFRSDVSANELCRLLCDE